MADYRGGKTMIKRKHLYQAGKAWGDVNAVKSGNVVLRIIRRILGAFFGRVMGKI